MNWNKYPFLRLIVALSTGIVLGDTFVGLCLPDVLSLFLALLLVEMFLVRFLKSYRFRWVKGWVMLMVFVLVGYLRARMADGTERVTYFRSVVADQAGIYLARVCEMPTEKEKTVKTLLELRAFRSSESMMPVTGKVLAYLEKTDASAELRYGDMLAFSSTIGEVSPPMNPEEFDYRQYLKRRNVTGSVYLSGSAWSLVDRNQGNKVLSFAYRFRTKLLSILNANGITEAEFGVGAAILLGYDDSLPTQVRNNYVAAGAMHILCVSGMHVGIIYMLASFLLGFLAKSKKTESIRKILLILLIWFYALLTGLSPSILRSTFMITFLVFGSLIHRKGFTLNSMAASAFMLLLVNPNNLYAVGFQLSYAAVMGIFLLQRPLHNLVFIPNKWLDKIWEITVISIAAQIATMPFTVYYFQQCTPYFWLSNLFMTPTSFVVILMGMLLFLLSWVPWLGHLLGKLLWMGLHGMNGFVSWIERLPFSVVKGLYMNDFELILSLLMLLLLFLLVNLRKKRMLMELLMIGGMLSCSLAIRGERGASQHGVMVYSLRNHTALDFIDGGSHVLLCDEGLLAEASSMDYSLKGCWAKWQLGMNPPCYALSEDVTTPLVMKRRQLVSFGGRLFAFWDPLPKGGWAGHRLPVDYLVVRGRQRPDLPSAERYYQVGTLLIDGSVPAYLAEEWIFQAKQCHTPYINVREGGTRLDF